MRNKISGLIGILWGGGIVVSRLLSESPASGAYQTGQTAGLAFGVVLLGAGLYYFFKKP
ncbi:LPXTG cell wall anchor domain-containing protein [Pseudoxanthomonas sp. LH2527]|uniref:LPXTG cell wall anchor domain-containing protein n=1 Tax=Pseudoxanthomonas sp. LH2527 TaxID=2923249 RepID=UPI001F1315EE|nr:LPXTG cell wall anchor domain-containing protein [Pseudoxanthomonas sp. LH2527]MCH6483265.1 LPXTG cell wall anchor domain-containing protein [Pseudoxanthomonas sp. LH2527]